MLKQCLSRPPLIKYIDNRKQHKTAYGIAYVTLKSFVHDCIELVKSAVEPSIRSDLASTDPVIKRNAERRKHCLKLWSKLVEPLAFGRPNRGDSSCMSLLIEIIVKDRSMHKDGLPMSETRRITYRSLGQAFYDMGKEQNPIPFAAPVNPKGPFAVLLPIAVKYLASLNTSLHLDDYVVSIFELVLHRLNIQFLPWHSGAPNNRSRTARSPNANYWVTLDREASVNSVAAEKRSAAEQAAESLRLAEPNAPWTASVPLNRLIDISNKTELPSDWSLKSASLTTADRLMSNTYEYIQGSYNGGIWYHKMAILMAILFSRVTPRVFFKSSDLKTLTAGLTGAQLTVKIRRFSWVNNESSRKGASNPLPFITMVSSYIIAILDESSPLNEHMARSKNSMGSWATKHSMFLVLCSYSMCQPISRP
jgi:hypothetical protein